MLKPEDRAIQAKINKNQNARQATYRRVVEQLQIALKKSLEQRFHTEQQHILEFIEKSVFFSEIANGVSLDFAKSIVCRSKVYIITGKKKLYQKGDKLDMIFMPLHGNIFTNRDSISLKSQPQSIEQTYEDLVRRAPDMSIQSRGIMQMEKRSSMLHSQPATVAIPNWEGLSNLQEINQEGSLLLGDLQKEKHTEDIYVKGQAWLLGITLRLFKQCLLDEYDRLIIQQTVYFRNMRCFDVLQTEELKSFVQKIALVEYKKDEFIFREGDKSEYMYLLIEGEVKTSKNAELFKEDPNCLYRRIVNSQCGRRPQSPLNLSYANFEGVYNYSPKKRKIQLSIISPVTVCGQEEVSAKIPREADLQVISTKAKAYKFTLKQLQTAGNNRKIDVATFINVLFESTTRKRIQSRRQSLCSSLEFQNKRNMNYFFLDASTPQDKKAHTFRQKINHSIFPSKKKLEPSEVKPTFDSFNFNQFLQGARPSKRKDITLNPEQRRITRLTHNSFEITDQVQNSSRMYKRLKSYKHKININTPLFDSNYYKKQRRETVRIENKRRMNMIAVKGGNSHTQSSRKIIQA